jgi:hypothetical protein
MVHPQPARAAQFDPQAQAVGVVQELAMGIPVRGGRTDVSPETIKGVRLHVEPQQHRAREDVSSEVVRASTRRVGGQHPAQHRRVEDIDTHRHERAGRFGGLLLELDDPPRGIEMDHAEAARLVARHLHHGDRYIGAGLVVLREERAVVHPVDVVSREHNDGGGSGKGGVGQILVHGVGGACVRSRRRREYVQLSATAVEAPRRAAADIT